MPYANYKESALIADGFTKVLWYSADAVPRNKMRITGNLTGGENKVKHKRPSNPLVKELLGKIQAIHDSKNDDYAEKSYYENFERAAYLISWFKDDIDKTFVNHIATKLARLATLLSSGNEPNHEAIDDTMLDLCTYCVLWSTEYKERKSLTSI